jgi:transcriptional regulator with XRE-family HTH domain
MSDLLQTLKTEFQDENYRYAYAESFLNTKIAAQVKTLREQRKKTQAEVAAQMGIKQPGYRRFEDVNHSVWKTDSLWAIARALGVRLNISFETFGTLPDDKKRFNKEALRRPEFKDDPAFKDQAEEAEQSIAESPLVGGLAAAANLKVGDLAGLTRMGKLSDSTQLGYGLYASYRPSYMFVNPNICLGETTLGLGSAMSWTASKLPAQAETAEPQIRAKGRKLIEMPKRTSDVTKLKRRIYARREQRTTRCIAAGQN